MRLRDLPRGYWKYLLCVAVFGIGNSSNAFIILKATSIGIPTELTILVYAAFNLIAAAIFVPGRGLVRHVGSQATVPGRPGDLRGGLTFVLYGAYQGSFRVVGKALAIDLVPQRLRASGVGLYASTLGLTALVASSVGGQLWVQLGPAPTFLYGAFFALVSALLLAALVPRRTTPTVIAAP